MQILNQLPLGSFDLHIHTTCSDGSYSPREIVQRAKEVGLSTIAITDHDTLAGVAEAIEAGEACGMDVIPGVEISTRWQQKSVDILGYNLTHYLTLHNNLSVYREARVDRAKQIIDRFCELGFPLTIEDVLPFSQGGVIARPHIAQAIVQKGYVSSVQEVFDHYLADGKPASVAKKELSVAEGVELIHQAGGVAILAHPIYLENRKMIEEILQQGLDGIEVWHRSHSAGDVRLFREIATEHHLLVTGGSDFHHAEHPLGRFMA